MINTLSSIYHNNEEISMGKKQHFAIVPDKLIAKRDPKRLQLYCELYMLLVSNQDFNLRHFAKDHRISYNICYALLREARQTLSYSRTKKSNYKQSKNNNKQNTKNNCDKSDEYEMQRQDLTKQLQNKDKQNQKKSKRSAEIPRPIGISEGLKLELKLKKNNIINSDINHLLSFAEILELEPEERRAYIDKNRALLEKRKII